MKQIYLAFFLLAVVGLSACRKDGNDIDIKTYDQQQIDAYIKANNLSGMKRDLTDGDTTGIYYEILAQGKGEQVDYSSQIAYVFTVKSLDGTYSSTDTIANHSYGYLGSLTPKGLMLALRNLVKFKGTRARVIIPSRLAYGKSGLGTGSSRLRGNNSLEFYINLMDDYQDPSTKTTTRQNTYDELSIRKYAAANGIDLSTYHHEASGLFWKQTQADTGKVAITDASTVYLQYTGMLFNGDQFDNGSNAIEGGRQLAIEGLIPGFAEGLKKVKAGAFLSLFIPTSIGYGYPPQTETSSTGALITTVPAFSCMRFEMKVLTVTNN